MCRWAADIAIEAHDRAIFAISRQNEIYEQIQKTGVNLVEIDTFNHSWGAILSLHRIFSIRRQIRDAIKAHRISRVIILMSHVWTPFLAKTVRQCGAQYIVIVHDAIPHPGDPSARVHWWLMRDALQADKIITLSAHVADQLVKHYPAMRGRVHTFFHPLLGKRNPIDRTISNRPLKFLFFGRIMKYKGLSLFVEACEILRREKLSFEISVIGEGRLGHLRTRLSTLRAEIVNRWIHEDEIYTILQDNDVVVVPSTEASQSGVIPIAFAAGLPVVATPIGGLREQLDDGETGILADAVSAQAIARAMRRLILDPDLRMRLTNGVRQVQEKISMARFLSAVDGMGSLDAEDIPKVLIVSHRLAIGGTENHLVHILPKLSQYGIAASLFLLERGGMLETVLAAKNVSIAGPPSASSNLHRVIQGGWHLYGHLRRHRTDIVHFFLPEPYLIGSLASMLAGAKVRVMSRRSLARYQQRHRILAVFEKWLHRHTHVLLGNSNAVVDDLIRECNDRSKIGLIYNGVEVPDQADDEVRKKAREDLGLSPNCLILVIVANLVFYKGHEDLLRALALAQEQLPREWQLLVIGRDDGIGSSLKETAASLGLGKHVVWFGECQDAERFFFVADIAVIASHEEGFSNSLIEAMARGLPVIATAVGGNLDAIVNGESGLLVPAKAPQALAQAIVSLADDPELRSSLGAAARCRVINLFSLEACVRRYANLYKSGAQFGRVAAQVLIEAPTRELL